MAEKFVPYPFEEPEHSQYNVKMPIDLGGTKYDFRREAFMDKDVFILREGSVETKIELPYMGSFFTVSKAAVGGKSFLNAYYNVQGDMTAADIWLRRFYDQPDFAKTHKPNRGLIDSYRYLEASGTDIMLEADLSQGTFGIYHCSEESRDDRLEIIFSAEDPITYNQETLIRM